MLAIFLLLAQIQGPVLPVSKPWYDSRAAHKDSWKVCALTAGDLVTTEAILARGGREYSPLVRNRGIRLGVGALGCIALHDLSGKDPEKARKLARIAMVVRGLAFAWNLKGVMARPELQ